MRYGTQRILPRYSSGVKKWDYGRAVKPRAVFIHIMEGHLSGTDGWFRNPRSGTTSTHFGIGYASWMDRLTGRVSVYQWVDTENTAYGTAVTRYPVSPLAKSVLGDLIGRIDVNHAIIHIEIEGYPTQRWPPGFITALNGLLAALKVHGPLMVMRHNDVSSKTCPGTATPWDRIVPTYGQRLGVAPSLPDTRPEALLPVKFQAFDPPVQVSINAGVNVRTSPRLTSSNIVTTTKQATNPLWLLGATVGDIWTIGSAKGSVWYGYWQPNKDTSSPWDGRILWFCKPLCRITKRG